MDELTENTFSSNTRFVQELHLDRCQLLKLPSELLKPLAALVTVDISFNNLITIPEGFFHNQRNLKRVYLLGNKIQHLQNIFYGNIQLEKLKLSCNKISSLKDVFHNITSIQNLTLYHNQIRSLSQDDFSSYTKLRSVSFMHNYISVIASNTFSNQNALVYLSLAYNHLVVLNHSIQNLPLLETLDLMSNNLVQIDEHEMKNLPQLKYLNLRYNKLKTVNGAFRDIHSLISLGINGNKLRTLSRISFSRDFNVKRLGLALIVLSITSTILLHFKYRYHLKVWLYSRGLTWLKKAEDQDFGKLHDAYISAAEEDLHLIVRYLIPELEEKDPYYSLYVPGRDMLGGEFEIDKQMEEVKKSKRVIILLSELQYAGMIIHCYDLKQ
ncbi:leucine-rich repeat-containing protein 15-like [Uloborus diversus]|uniref:leucine-rich repeat-containing protein 15-like n=1 Tax=Uloborus diversus TaxID=327109 RepID=UPI00240A7820|nr:leucine-rich repeat-containing protein 15-like [Uloborus diversus]